MHTVNKLNTIFAAPPFDPRSIPGLKLWLAADRIVGLNDGDPVGTWSDLSGNGNDATQATGSKQPIYKLNGPNGKPYLQFDGVDDFLRRTFGASISQPATVLLVARFDSDPSLNSTLFDFATSAKDVLRGAGPCNFGNVSAGTFISAGTWGFSNFKLFVGVLNGATGLTRLNGSQIATGNTGTQALDRAVLGQRGDATGQNPAQCKQAELALYSSALSTVQMQQLEAYANAKYAIY